MTLYVYTVSVIKKGKFNMANYLQLGQGLMKHLPTAEGCTSTVKLSKKGIEALAKKNPELGKVIEGMTRGAENPTLEIAQKAKGNYAIAGFKIRNGETILGKGAYSTSTGANGVVEKMHVESGDIITTVTKEGDKVVSKNVSKSELAKAAQEKAKASEYTTKVRKGKKGFEGDEVLVRKFKDGTTVETSTYDGIVQTKVTKADGTSYIRRKQIESKSLSDEEARALKQIYPDILGFTRLNKGTRVLNDGSNGFVELPNQGFIYGVDMNGNTLRILKYKGKNARPIQDKGKNNYLVEMLNPKAKDKYVKKCIGVNDKTMRGETVPRGTYGADLTDISRYDLAKMIGESDNWAFAPNIK